jgi:hypothetical protein
MWRLIKLLFWTVLIAIIAAPIAFLILGLEDRPLVASGGEPTPEDLKRARSFIEANDPRRLQPGERRSVSVEQRDINLASDYALSRLPGKWPMRSRVAIEESFADLFVTVQLKAPPEAVYLNVNATASDAEQPFRLERLKVGQITLAGWLVRPLAGSLHGLLNLFEPYAELSRFEDSIRELHFKPEQVDVVFLWQPELLETITRQGRELLLSLPERQRLSEYSRYIDAYAAAHAGQHASLTGLLRASFEEVRKRGGGVDENRAALLALGLYTSGRDLSPILGDLGEGLGGPRPRMTLTLNGRKDLARHFLISAAIAASANPAIADTFGLYKEVEDAKTGSGFSFSDLAADRAGVRLAEEATAKGGDRAAEIGARLAALAAEADFMPATDALPDNLSAPAFQQQFQDRNSEAYRLLTAEIERRIDACPVFF